MIPAAGVVVGLLVAGLAAWFLRPRDDARVSQAWLDAYRGGRLSHILAADPADDPPFDLPLR